MTSVCKAVVTSVRPGSLADAAGVLAGDCLLSLNGAPIRDQIDYRFEMADTSVHAEVERKGVSIPIDFFKEPEDDLGLGFTEATFDGVRRCRNRCLFCFVDRLPRGLRPSLYVKDDDYRYSFLFGSFITLTNLEESDWSRIEAQRLSPLFVSVHATDLAARRRLLGNPTAPDITQQLRRLADTRIQVHAQIVLCPEINDGDVLEKTLSDLVSLERTIASVAVVPVGLTRFGPPSGPRRLTREEMRRTMRQVARWQRHARRSLGRTFVYLGDEFYIRTGATMPAGWTYDGFPQYENGVGLARVLLDEWSHTRRRLEQAVAPPRVTLVTGELAAPLLQRVTSDLNTRFGANVAPVVIANDFFGPDVTVAGLLTARDVVAGVRSGHLGDIVVLPRSMFDSTGAVTLDGQTREDIEDALGTRVAVAASVGVLASIAVSTSDFGGSTV